MGMAAGCQMPIDMVQHRQVGAAHAPLLDSLPLERQNRRGSEAAGGREGRRKWPRRWPPGLEETAPERKARERWSAERGGAWQRRGAGDAHGECPRRPPAIPPNRGPNGPGDSGWGRASRPRGRGRRAGVRPARPEPREPGHGGRFPAAFRGSRRRINAAERRGGSNVAEGLGPASGAPWAGVCSGVRRSGARGSAEWGDGRGE